MDDIYFTEIIDGVIGIARLNSDKMSISELAFCKKDVNPEIFNLISAAPAMLKTLTDTGAAATMIHGIMEEHVRLSGQPANELMASVIKTLKQIELNCVECRVIATDGLKATLARRIDNVKN